MSTHFKYIYVIFFTRKRKTPRVCTQGDVDNLINYSVVILVDEHRYSNDSARNEHSHSGVEAEGCSVVEEALNKERNANTTRRSGDDHLKILAKEECQSNCNCRRAEGNRKVALGVSGELRKEECVEADVVNVKADTTDVNEVVDHSRKNSRKQPTASPM